MPVRGHGHYKRPYRLSYIWNGRTIHKAFHWRGPWQAEIDWCIHNKLHYLTKVVKADL